MINEGKGDIEEVKMPATRLKCGLPSCTLGEGDESGGAYMTPAHLSTIDQTQIAMNSHMEVHRMLISQVNPQVGGGRESVGTNDASKPDRLPCPTIHENATDTEWDYFVASWEAYKRATKLDGQSAVDHLWHCPTEDLRKKVFSSGISHKNNVQELLDGIKKMSVQKHNNMVRVMEFKVMKQAQG